MSLKFHVPRFFDRIPSWLTELLSGLITVVLALLILFFWQKILPPAWQGSKPPAIVVLLLATSMSAVYEQFFDQNGWNWTDLCQREMGILLSVGVYAFALPEVD